MIGDLLPGLAIAHGPDAWNEGYLGPLVLDAAQRDLGYAPRVALRDGLAGLIGQLGAAADGSA